jgi:hypothetical protein
MQHPPTRQANQLRPRLTHGVPKESLEASRKAARRRASTCPSRKASSLRWCRSVIACSGKSAPRWQRATGGAIQPTKSETGEVGHPANTYTRPRWQLANRARAYRPGGPFQGTVSCHAPWKVSRPLHFPGGSKESPGIYYPPRRRRMPRRLTLTVMIASRSWAV